MSRVLALMMALLVTSAFAQVKPQKVSSLERMRINAFFGQYGLIGEQGFDAFAKAREGLFSPTANTLVNDGGQVNYRGPKGHIQSLKDWFALYRVSVGFGYEIVPLKQDGNVEVRMRGVLVKSVEGTELVISESDHNWTEYFRFNELGQIEYFQVDMNIQPGQVSALQRSVFG